VRHAWTTTTHLQGAELQVNTDIDFHIGALIQNVWGVSDIDIGFRIALFVVSVGLGVAMTVVGWLATFIVIGVSSDPLWVPIYSV
jgi:hypothetical protein